MSQTDRKTQPKKRRSPSLMWWRSNPTASPQALNGKQSSLVNANGTPTIERRGLQHGRWQDLYYWVLTMSWAEFLLLTTGAYFASNLLFAIAYLLGGDCIANARSGSVLDAFFFSVQTMATIGYGVMYPKTNYANFLVAIEALVGLVGVAMATGLMFARFSRPTARVLFSRVAIVGTFEGQPMLMFRAANQRGNQILEARLWATLVQDEHTSEGYSMRRIRDLKLVRSHTPFFFLSWLALHPIDEDSPFFGATSESLAAKETIMFVTITGTDETVTQTVHARHAYTVENILWHQRFVDVFLTLPDGRRVLDYTYFHDVEPIDP